MVDRGALKQLTTTQLLETAHRLSEGELAFDSEERWDAITALHCRAERLVLDTCSKWAREGTAWERALAADVIAQVGSEQEPRPFQRERADLLQGLLGDTDSKVLASALVALGHRGASDHVAQIIRFATHPSGDVRHSVAFALLGIEDQEAVDTLILLSRDADTSVRDWAVFGLGSQIDTDTPELREALLVRATDCDDDTRAEALMGLARRGDARVVEPLLAALKGESVGTLDVEAAEVCGAKELLPALEALRDWEAEIELVERAIAACKGNA
jgi:HEAT repeat protein